MGGVVFVFILATLFLVISLFLFAGKGSWLIAGYNTASAKEKQKFDKKKLCKGAGFVTLVVALSLYAMTFLCYQAETGAISESQLLPFAALFLAVILAAIGINIYYVNKKV